MKKLGFGFMRLPLTNEDDPSSIDMQKSKQMGDLLILTRLIHIMAAKAKRPCGSF